MKVISQIIWGALFLLPLKSLSQVRAGLIGGISSANLKATNYGPVPDSARARFTGVTRYRAGLFTSIPINRFFSIHPELAYSEKGANMEQDSSFTVADRPPGWTETFKTRSEITFGYLELPLLVRFSAHLFTIRKRLKTR